MRKVVITGVGVVAPCGVGKTPFWEGLEAGRSYIHFDEEMDSMAINSHALCRVTDFDVHQWCDDSSFPDLSNQDRFVQFGVVAGKQALEDAGLADDSSIEDAGIIFSSAIGGTPTVAHFFEQLSDYGRHAINYQPVGPNFYNAGMFNFPAALLAQRYRLHGPVTSLSTGCTAGLDALGLGFELIKSGDASVMLVGASEAPLVNLTYATLDIIGALSVADCEPEKASRPFDKKRAGFVISEGAACLVLEDEEHALERGATIYGEVINYASVSNAFHMTDLSPDGDEMVRVIEQALAPVDRTQIDYINAHGSSTPQNDIFETNAFKKVFGEYAYRIPISSTKSMVGHSLSSASLIGVIATLGAINRSVIHPTVNYEVPDPDCDLDYVPNVARQQSVKMALVTASGFGGIHSASVFRKYGDLHE
jgi:3-oxoacyl-(acyl-carrier-protein) synthase